MGPDGGWKRCVMISMDPANSVCHQLIGPDYKVYASPMPNRRAEGHNAHRNRGHVSHRKVRRSLVRTPPLGRRGKPDRMPPARMYRKTEGEGKRKARSVLLWRLPKPLQRPVRNRHAVLADTIAQMADQHIPLDNVTQGRQQHGCSSVFLTIGFPNRLELTESTGNCH